LKKNITFEIRILIPRPYMKKLLLHSLFVFALTAFYHLSVSAQGVYNMCSVTTIGDSTGTLYDSGGLNGEYQSSEDCTLLIAPSCADSITLTFHSFNTEANYDYIHVYNGATTSDPELLVADGTTIPGPVTTGGLMLIVWESDPSITRAGFECSWTSVIAPSFTPVAAFTIGNTNPPLSVDVEFTNTSSTNTTGWLWDFGDGDTARSENPTHAYSTPGNYTVTFVAFQCSETDTITHNLTVQGAPQIEVDPDTGFTASVACGDSATFNLAVSNIAGGDLVFNTTGTNVGKVKVLSMAYGVNQFVEYPNTINSIHQYFTNDTITKTTTSDPGTLYGLLIGKNVLLIPEQSSGSASTWINLAPVIKQYLTNGGSVVFCGSAGSFADNLFVTDIFTGTYADDETGFSLDILDNADPLMNGISASSMIAPSATYSMNFTNTDLVTVVESNGNDVVAYRYFGAGKAIYVGFDYHDPNPNAQRIIANAIEWGGKNALPPWIHLSTSGDTVAGGNTSNVGVTFVASGFPAGTYYASIGIGSNDPLNPLVIVPCTLTVSGLPIIALSENCLNLGQVMQHTTATDTFRVINNGCDTLKINNITHNSGQYTINAAFSYLLPGAFGNVIVNFNSATVGTFRDTIHILNNDVDTSVCLTATTFPAPIVTPSTSTINNNIRACGASGSSTFDITNTGGSDLIFHLGSLPVWLSANPTADTLAPAASITITLNFGSGTFASGAQQANINIISNDPLAPNKNVAFVMYVDSNPCVDYTFVSSTCTGLTNFTTTTINTPTSYHWDFGDGDTSDVRDPDHFYTHNGTYNAVLIACNSRGCDTVQQTINAIITGPKATSCYPATLQYCCGIGITRFIVTDPFGFRFNKTSPDAVDGYKDYTCSDNSTLITNFPYSINVTTGFTYVETVKAWLDMNNDGVLDPATEQLYVDSAVLTNHAGTFFIPDRPDNVYNEPLRFRIASDYSGNPTPEPCLDLLFGQVEDYSVFLQFYDEVNEVDMQTGFNVYPNPFSQHSNIDFNLRKSAIVSVEVFNIIGEKVGGLLSEESLPSGKHNYQFGDQPSGVYFVKLTVDGKSSVKKIIKM